MKNIDKIRDACIKANPEIMELSFGCELLRIDSDSKYQVIQDRGFAANRDYVWINSVPFGSMKLPREIEKNEITDTNGEKWKILGRPIRLADILLTLGDRGLASMSIMKGGDYASVSFIWEPVAEMKHMVWNLKDDSLEKQNEEAINFIASLL